MVYQRGSSLTAMAFMFGGMGGGDQPGGDGGHSNKRPWWAAWVPNAGEEEEEEEDVASKLQFLFWFLFEHTVLVMSCA